MAGNPPKWRRRALMLPIQIKSTDWKGCHSMKLRGKEHHHSSPPPPPPVITRTHTPESNSQTFFLFLSSLFPHVLRLPIPPDPPPDLPSCSPPHRVSANIDKCGRSHICVLKSRGKRNGKSRNAYAKNRHACVKHWHTRLKAAAVFLST